MPQLQRRPARTVHVGDVLVGGCQPVVIQSMTNTDTADVEGTVAQTEALFRAGSELVRITVNTKEAARAVPEIGKRLRDRGVEVPLIGDFHYNGHLLLTDYPDCARTLAKYRINPGNVGMGRQQDDNFRTIIDVARDNDKPVRIGVNWGSLDQSLLTEMMDRNAGTAEPVETGEVIREAIIVSAVRSVELATSYGMSEDRIILSAKVSRVGDLIDLYRELAQRTECALHVGLTEAGMGRRGIVASTAALSTLLMEGIGDTIRVSLTPVPGGDRTEEVRVCQDILQSLGLRSFSPHVTACPGCGRTTSTFFQEMASEIEQYIERQMPTWKTQYPGVEELEVAVMGCVVNGPGESKHSDIGISLPGNGEDPKAPVYVDSRLMTTLKGDRIVAEFILMLEDYVENRYSSKSK